MKTAAPPAILCTKSGAKQQSVLSRLCVLFLILFPLILAQIVGEPHEAFGKMHILHDHIFRRIKINMGEIPPFPPLYSWEASKWRFLYDYFSEKEEGC